MCHVFEKDYILCSHSEKILKKCQASFDKERKSNSEGRKRKGWLKKLLSSFSTTKEGCECSTARLRVPAYCTSCSIKNDLAQNNQKPNQRQDDNIDEITGQAYNKDEAEQKAEQEEQDKRSKFQCFACAVEGRSVRSKERNPKVNSGLCCARGVDEYYAQEGRDGRYSQPLLLSGYEQPPTTDSTAVTHNWQVEIQPMPRREPPTGYTWDDLPGQSVDLSRDQVKEFIYLPGMSIDDLPSPRPFPSPMHKEPGIDWGLWAQATQSHHGRYPPATVPPRKPLPQPPLRHKSEQARSNASNMVGRWVDDVEQRHLPSFVPPRNLIPKLDLRTKDDQDQKHSCDIVDQIYSPRSILPRTPTTPALLEHKGDEESSYSRDIVNQPRNPASRYRQLSPPPVSPLTTTHQQLTPWPLKSVASRLDDLINKTLKFWEKK